MLAFLTQSLHAAPAPGRRRTALPRAAEAVSSWESSLPPRKSKGRFERLELRAPRPSSALDAFLTAARRGRCGRGSPGPGRGRGAPPGPPTLSPSDFGTHNMLLAGGPGGRASGVRRLRVLRVGRPGQARQRRPLAPRDGAARRPHAGQPRSRGLPISTEMTLRSRSACRPGFPRSAYGGRSSSSTSSCPPIGSAAVSPVRPRDWEAAKARQLERAQVLVRRANAVSDGASVDGSTAVLDARSRCAARWRSSTCALVGGGRGHVGAALSLVEIVRVLYDDVLRVRLSRAGRELSAIASS